MATSTTANHTCPDCGDEVGGGFAYHGGCCPHRQVEEVDNRDGVAGRLFSLCLDCDTEVWRTPPDEDGDSYWERAD
jgi:hypothetical protein